MTPLERAKDAVLRVRYPTVDFDSQRDPEMLRVVHEIGRTEEIARAVLRAIRYAPDDDFFALAGAEIPPEFQSRGDKGVIACTIWQAMIDAALGEG